MLVYSDSIGKWKWHDNSKLQHKYDHQHTNREYYSYCFRTFSNCGYRNPVPITNMFFERYTVKSKRPLLTGWVNKLEAEPHAFWQVDHGSSASERKRVRIL